MELLDIARNNESKTQKIIFATIALSVTDSRICGAQGQHLYSFFLDVMWLICYKFSRQSW